MKKYIEARELPEEDKVYLKKGFDGWRIVHPIKNEDGTTNWINLIFGGKANAFRLILYILLISILYMGINEVVGNYRAVAEDPCSYCLSAPQNQFKFDCNPYLEGLGICSNINFSEEFNLSFDISESTGERGW